MAEVIHDRELAVVKILAVTTATYVVMALPISIMNVADYCVQHPNYRSVFYSIYVWMYVLNFLIYVGAHPLYKESCVNLGKKMMSAMSRKNHETTNKEDESGKRSKHSSTQCAESSC
jgi:hypothetical protein